MGTLNLEESRISENSYHIKAERNLILDKLIRTTKKKWFVERKTFQEDLSKFEPFINKIKGKNELTVEKITKNNHLWTIITK